MSQLSFIVHHIFKEVNFKAKQRKELANQRYGKQSKRERGRASFFSVLSMGCHQKVRPRLKLDLIISKDQEESNHFKIFN